MPDDSKGAAGGAAEAEGGGAGDAQERKDVEQAADTLLRYLIFDVRRSRTNRKLAYYSVFMIILMVQVVLTSAELDRHSVRYYFTQSALGTFKWSDFQNVESTDAFWGWAKSTAASFPGDDLQGFSSAAGEPADANSRIGFMLMRVWRVERRRCPNPGATLALPRAISKYLDRDCKQLYASRPELFTDDFYCGVGELTANAGCDWSEAERRNPSIKGVDTSRLRNQPPWGGDGLVVSPEKRSLVANRSRDVVSVPLFGVLNSYPRGSKVYTAYIPLHNRTEAELELGSLKELGVVDTQTRAVSLEFLNYNKVHDRFILLSLLLEFEPSGVAVASAHQRHFQPLSNKHLFILFLDFGLLVYLAWDGCDSLRVHWHTRVLERDASQPYQLIGEAVGFFRFWGVLQLLTTALFGVAYGYRIRLWFQSLDLTNGKYYTNPEAGFEGHWSWALNSPKLKPDDVLQKMLWQVVLSSAELSFEANRFLAIAVCTSWVRFFGLVKFNDRLSILTETMKAAARDLLSLLVPLGLIVIGWSIAAMYLYGGTLREFRTFTSTFTYLMFMIASNSIGEYEKMDQIHPILTPVFFAAFIALSFLIILNLIIGIITGYFQMVQYMMQKETSWNPAMIWHDCKEWLIERRKDFILCLLKPCDEGRDTSLALKETSDELRVNAVRMLRYLQSGKLLRGWPKTARCFGLTTPLPRVDGCDGEKLPFDKAEVGQRIRMVPPDLDAGKDLGVCSGQIIQKLADQGVIRVRWEDAGSGGPKERLTSGHEVPREQLISKEWWDKGGRTHEELAAAEPGVIEWRLRPRATSARERLTGGIKDLGARMNLFSSVRQDSLGLSPPQSPSGGDPLSSPRAATNASQQTATSPVHSLMASVRHVRHQVAKHVPWPARGGRAAEQVPTVRFTLSWKLHLEMHCHHTDAKGVTKLYVVSGLRYKEVAATDGEQPRPYFPAKLYVYWSSVDPPPSEDPMDRDAAPPNPAKFRMPQEMRPEILAQLKLLAARSSLRADDVDIPDFLTHIPTKPISLEQKQFTVSEFQGFLDEVASNRFVVFASGAHGGEDDAEEEDDFDAADPSRAKPADYRKPDEDRGTVEAIRQETVHDLFTRANRELIASASSSVKVRDDLQEKLRRKLNYVEELPQKTGQIKEACRDLKYLNDEVKATITDTREYYEHWKQLRGLHTVLTAILPVIEKSLQVIDKLEESLQLITGQSKAIAIVHNRSAELSRVHEDLKVLVKSTDSRLRSRTEYICEKAGEGLEFALPTAHLKEVAPVLHESCPGKGVIDRVERFAFQRPQGDLGREELRVRAASLEPQPGLSMAQTLKFAKLSTDMLREVQLGGEGRDKAASYFQVPSPPETPHGRSEGGAPRRTPQPRVDLWNTLHCLPDMVLFHASLHTLCGLTGAIMWHCRQKQLYVRQTGMPPPAEVENDFQYTRLCDYE
eukprot:TRINITY_DN64822_c0_g1_i1.p1 TRINITY_DN64822_c0_g1~~TRINITY_DN64822_c0_g1_i1.p1  ORF type:complete len:1439 (+),score=463.00 TRINITY_DN64822_c0_g1_i1:76-4392(+)